MFGIQHRLNCGDEICQVDILTLTNRNSGTLLKKKVLVSSGQQGDEQLGPHVLLYFLEYILSIKDNGEELQRRRINNLLSRTEITMVPLINPVGFYRDEGGERLTDEAAAAYGQETVDIVTDFPYD